MLELTTGHSTNCEGMTRRDLVRVGGLGVFGLSLPALLRAQRATADQSQIKNRKSEINCIVLWMDGGPSHLDTFAPKPNAPTEIRGPMGVVSTNVPGVQISEWLPQLAQVMDKYSIIRSLTSPNGSHGPANHYMMTGYNFTPVVNYPSYGAVLSRERGLMNNGLPTYAAIGNNPFRQGFGTPAGYMGTQYNPFGVGGDPAAANFSVRDVSPASGTSFDRVERRKGMLDAVDRFQRDVETRQDAVKAVDKFYESAFSLVTSPGAKKAFNLKDEQDSLRDRYGRNTFGQSCLLARRLIESGVRFVTVTRNGWDTHTNNFVTLKNTRLPEIDQGYSALLTDLDQRGMLDSTIVIWMGEFGRTPKINTSAGRDHWPYSTVVTIGGGGLKRGVVVGDSDETAAYPSDKPYRIEDLAATIYHALGIDTEKEYLAPDNRPLKVNYDGKPMVELI